MKFIINLSKKKTGTKFFYRTFKKNENLFKKIFIPTINEFYFFPRRTKKYYNLSENAVLQNTTSNSDNLFKEKIINDIYRKKIISLLEKNDLKKIPEINNERIKYLLHDCKYKCLLISDPNFLDDFRYWSNEDTVNLINTDNSKFISVIRNPINSSLSLINMEKKNYSDFKIKEIFLRQYSIVHSLALFKKIYNNPEILLIDFDELILNTENCFKKILEFCGIDYNKIKIINNPNPGNYDKDVKYLKIKNIIHKYYSELNDKNSLFQKIKKYKYLKV